MKRAGWNGAQMIKALEYDKNEKSKNFGLEGYSNLKGEGEGASGIIFVIVMLFKQSICIFRWFREVFQGLLAGIVHDRAV